MNVGNLDEAINQIIRTETETFQERLIRLEITEEKGYKQSNTDFEGLKIAHPLVDDVTLKKLAKADVMSRESSIILPAHRFESLSRGRGWARKGTGDKVEWGEKIGGKGEGYRVGPGRWIVGGHDGFNRKKDDTWIVESIQVGQMIWTVANA